MITKRFVWERNPNADDYTEEYGEFVPLRISALKLYRKTLPSTASAGRERAVLTYLKGHTEVYTPILVWHPVGDGAEEPANDLVYLDGRHTVNALAGNFGDPTITILVPRQDYRQIAALLDESSAGEGKVAKDGVD